MTSGATCLICNCNRDPGHTRLHLRLRSHRHECESGFHMRVVCHSYKLHPHEWNIRGLIKDLYRVTKQSIDNSWSSVLRSVRGTERLVTKLLSSVRRTELKEPKLLKAVRRSEVRLIRPVESARRTYCTAIDFTATNSAVEMVNRFINLKLTNISTFNYKFTIIKY